MNPVKKECEGINPKCQICRNAENLTDTWMEDSSFIHQKLREIIDCKDNYISWLRFICLCCRSQLDLWDFRVLCKRAYQDFLDGLLQDDDLRTDFNATGEEEEEIVSNIEIGTEELYYEVIEVIRQSDEEMGMQTQCEEGEIEDSRRVETSKKVAMKRVSKDSKMLVGRKNRKSKRRICSFCRMKFTYYSQLLIHERIHTGEKPFLCDLCSKAFSTKNIMKRHMQVHMKVHKEKGKYECKDCNKRFISKQGWTIHKRIHTGEKPYECPTCSTRFYWHSSCSYHMKKCSEMFKDGTSSG